jgi:hypothetical protein
LTLLEQFNQIGNHIGRGVGGAPVVLQPRALLKEMAKVIGETFPKNLTYPAIPR